MDKIDWKILTELEGDGRLSFADLSERVGLSKSPCWSRVRDLEADGVIGGPPPDGVLVDPAQQRLEPGDAPVDRKQHRQGSTLLLFDRGEPGGHSAERRHELKGALVGQGSGDQLPDDLDDVLAGRSTHLLQPFVALLIEPDCDLSRALGFGFGHVWIPIGVG